VRIAPLATPVSLIFISYRRDDSAPYAGRLYDRLTQHFGKGQVFMDIEQIEPGEDFVEVIGRKVGACEVAVVLIGKSWLSAVDGEGRRRLDDPEDFVRLEVAAALKRNVRVLPVLVGGAKMPKVQQLPEPLALLARRNAFDISDSRFHADVDKLIETIERAGSAADNSGPAPAATPRFGATAKALSMGGLAAVAVGVAAVVSFQRFVAAGLQHRRNVLPTRLRHPRQRPACCQPRACSAERCQRTTSASAWRRAARWRDLPRRCRSTKRERAKAQPKRNTVSP
jgi:hypothetical protein